MQNRMYLYYNRYLPIVQDPMVFRKVHYALWGSENKKNRFIEEIVLSRVNLLEYIF